MDACETEACQRNQSELVCAAKQTPTPDSNRPWRFVATVDRLQIYLDSRRALDSDVNSMLMVFRIGHVRPPQVRSLQRPEKGVLEYLRND